VTGERSPHHATGCISIREGGADVLTRKPGDLPVAVGPLRGRGVQRDRGSSSRDDIDRGGARGWYASECSVVPWARATPCC